MKNLLLVQNNQPRIVYLATPLANAADFLGIDIHDMSYGTNLPNMRPLPNLSEYDKVFIFGSVGFIHDWAAMHPALKKWVYWNSALSSAKLWADMLGEMFHNHDGRMVTMVDAISSKDPPRHYRPIGTSKKIAGSILSFSELDTLAKTENIPDGFLLWSSAPKIIQAEVRIWVVNGSITMASTYRIYGTLDLQISHPFIPDAVSAAQKIINRFSPSENFVIDVGLVDNEWGLIEFNPIHSAGWYACDPHILLKTYFNL